MKTSLFSLAIVTIVGVVSFVSLPVSGHGRLWEPPARSTMWRRGFSTPVLYDDNQLFCGGFQHQLNLGYQCGTCGDPFDGVRQHEAGGTFATGTIAREYIQGQEVTMQVDLTANHKGFFEFKICPTNNPNVKATQACLDLYPLKMADNTGNRFPVTFVGPRMVDVRVKLPANLTCEFCVIQWRYHAGNNWGTDPNGRSCLGCGPQEEFYGCADVKIRTNNGGGDGGNGGSQGTNAPNPTTTTTTRNPNTAAPTQTQRPSTSTTTTTTTTTTTRRPAPSGNCRSRSGIPAYDYWCATNCARNYCPDIYCVCGDGGDDGGQSNNCRAIGVYTNVGGMHQWCVTNCGLGNCPATMCLCS